MWKKPEARTPEEQRHADRLDRERRNMESTKRTSPRTGSKVKHSACKVTVMPGYDAREALEGSGCGET